MSSERCGSNAELWRPALKHIPLTGPVTVLTASRKAILILQGWILCETTESARAKILFFDGPASGTPLASITLDPGESTRDFLPIDGIQLTTGRVTATVVLGSIEGSIVWNEYE